MTKSYNLIILFIILTVGLLLLSVIEKRQFSLLQSRSNCNNQHPVTTSRIIEQGRTNTIEDPVNLFLKMSLKHGRDKATVHSYQDIYGLYLGPIRTKRLVVLGIGLDCDGRAAGKSLRLWRDYLPNSRVHILEYNSSCAQRFKNLADQLYIGDQSDLKLLKQIASIVSYDVIIDDGGHTRKQQIYSLIGLWPALKSNGVYVIEDTFHTVTDRFNDLSISTIQVIEYFINKFNNKTIPSLYSEPLDQIFSSLKSVNCFREACALVKL